MSRISSRRNSNTMSLPAFPINRTRMRVECTLADDVPRKRARFDNGSCGAEARHISDQNEESDDVLMSAVNDVGVTLYEKGNYGLARQCFSRVMSGIVEENTLTTKPEDDKRPDPKLVNEYDEGLRIFVAAELSVGQDKKHLYATCLYNSAQVDIARKDYECALEKLECLIGNPELPFHLHFKAMHNKGYCLYRLERVEQAQEQYERTLEEIFRRQETSVLDIAACQQAVGVMNFHRGSSFGEKALESFKSALSLYRCFGRSTQVATTLNNIGRVHFLRGNHHVALKAYSEALRIRLDDFDTMSIDCGAVCFNMGQSLSHLGRFDEALVLYRNFLGIVRQNFGTAHKDYAAVCKAIAEILHKKGHSTLAVEMFTSALEASRACHKDSKHKDIASILNLRGQVSYEVQNYKDALEDFEKALEIERSIHSNDHPHVVTTLTNVALIHKQLGDHHAAIDLYREVLDIQKQKYGDSSLHVAATLSSIGLLQYQRRDFSGSFDSYQLALQIRRDAYKTNTNLDIASTLNSIGLVLFKKNHLDMAKDCFFESLRIRCKLLGKDHQDVAILWYNIATIHYEMGQEDVAVKFYQEALRVELTALGEEHPDVTLTLKHLGMILQQMGHLEPALEYLYRAVRLETQRCFQVSTSGRTPSNSLATLLNRVGNIQMQLGRVPEMMRTYITASRIFEANQVSGETLVVSGYNMYCMRKQHPPCAAMA